MAKYTVIQDFTANQFQFELPNPNPQTKIFKKGDRIEASEQTNFGMQSFLVSDGFIIPKDKVLLVTKGGEVMDGSGMLNNANGLPAIAKFGIAIVIILVIVGILKLFKVF